MNDELPLVSILICTYNRADRLRECLRSALSQNYPATEIVVVDDASEDHTSAVIAELEGRVRYHRLSCNGGVARARNAALALANGALVAFQDDDDLMPPDRIEELWKALQLDPEAVFSVGDVATIDSAGNPTGERWLPHDASESDEPRVLHDGYRAVLWPTVPAVPHTTLFRTEAARRIGAFDEQFRHAAEDKDFFARLALLGPIVYVPKTVSWQRRGHASLTGNSARTELAALALYRKHIALLEQRADPDLELRDRLQYRSAVSLQRMHRRLASGEDDPGSIPDDYEARYLAPLPLRLRMRVWWRTRVRYPLASRVGR